MFKLFADGEIINDCLIVVAKIAFPDKRNIDCLWPRGFY